MEKLTVIGNGGKAVDRSWKMAPSPQTKEEKFWVDFASCEESTSRILRPVELAGISTLTLPSVPPGFRRRLATILGGFPTEQKTAAESKEDSRRRLGAGTVGKRG